MDVPEGSHTKTKKSYFKTLPKNDKSVAIHVKNLQYNVTEIYKVKKKNYPDIMRDIFPFQEMKTTTYGFVPILL